MLRKSIIKTFVAAVLLSATVAGCMPNINPDTYGAYGAGELHQTVPGVVYSSRVVRVQGGGTGFGAVTGGVLGAVAGCAIGGGRGSIATGVGGAALGALAGNAIENRLSNQWGIEYVIKTCEGSLLTIVQGGPCQFQRGQHVLVVMGNCQSRVIPDPNY